MLIEPANAAALARLASGPPPRELKATVPSVLWLDDIEPFITAGENGLNARVLPDWFSAWARPVLIVGTAGGKGRRSAPAGEYADPLDDLLRRYPPLELAPWLSNRERQVLAANPTYPQVAAGRIGDEGVGEFMVVASRIRGRLGDESDCPEGLAVARAAIDWRRLGLIRAIPEPALRDLYEAYLPGPPLSGRFDTGITWATAGIYSTRGVALLRGADSYEPYDYAVRYDQERGRPIEAATWDAVINRYATDEELSPVGIAALDAEQPDHAEAAFRRADERGDAGGAYNLGVLLEQRGELQEAEAAYRRADERGDAKGASNLGVLLVQRGELQEAEAAYRRADERGLAKGASNLGALLMQRGELQEAEAAYRRADERDAAQASSD
jgi:tetratricopeptide (TPR) repeat protein